MNIYTMVVSLLSCRKRGALSLFLLLSLLPPCWSAEIGPVIDWARTFGGEATVQATSVTMGNGGTVHVVGNFRGTVTLGTNQLVSNGSDDAFFAKLDQAGNILWARSVGSGNGDYAKSVVVDGAGNVYVAGEFNGTVAFGSTTLTSQGNSYDVFVVKLDSNGNFIWAKSAGGNWSESAGTLVLNAAGDLFLSGFYGGSATFGSNNLTAPPFTMSEAFVTKLDGAGNFVWAARAGANYSTSPTTLAADSAGNVYVAGEFRDPITLGTNTLSTGNPLEGSFIAKLDGSGNYLWAKLLANATNGPAVAYPYAMTADASGHVIVVGRYQGTQNFGNVTLSSLPSADVFITQLDPDGNFLWATSAGGPGYDEARAVTVDAVGCIYVTGMFTPPNGTFGQTILTGNGSQQLFLTKLDRNGQFLWATNGTNLAGNSVAVDQAGNICVGGNYSGFATFGTNTFAINNGAAFVARLKPSPPAIAIRVSNAGAGTLSVLWPSTTIGFQLETASSLSPPVAWISAQGNRQTNNESIWSDVPAAGQARFFRIVRP
jgi:hypothetical protein